MNEIAKWLSKPIDYSRGVELLKSNGGSSILLMMLETGESIFNKNKLIAALEGMLAVPEVDEVPKADYQKPEWNETAAAIENAKKTIQIKPSSNTLKDTTTERLNDDLKLLYKRQSSAHSGLKLMVKLNHDLKDRQKKCFEILDIGKEIRAIGLVIREIKTNGHVPESVLKVEELNPAAQFRRALNNRSYISKFSDDPDKSEEMERRVMENLTLERILKN